MRRDATVTQLPVGNARRRHDRAVVDAIGTLSLLLSQADSFSRNTMIASEERAEFTGQVKAYAFAIGVLANPLCPPDAIQVKRDILEALTDGPLTAERIHEIAVADIEPPDAC